MRNIQINEVAYSVLEVRENITLADSFVAPKNKIGSGNGEAKLYIGNES